MRATTIIYLLLLFLLNISYAQTPRQLKKIDRYLSTYQIEKSSKKIQQLLSKTKPSHQQYGKLLFQKSKLQVQQGDYLAANQTIQQVLSFVSEEERAEVLTFQGQLLLILDQYEVADSLLKIAHQFYQQIPSPPLIDQTKTIIALGLLSLEKEVFEKADSLFSIAKKQLEQAQLQTTLPYIQVVYHTAESKLEQEQFDQAATLLREATDLLTKYFSKDHVENAYIQNHLGRLYTKKGNYEAAEQAYQKALLIRSNKYGTKHPLYARVLKNLGIVYYRLGQYAQAENVLLEAKSILAQKLQQTIEFGSSWNTLGLVYKAMGKNDKAIEAYTAAKDTYYQLNKFLDYSINLNNLATIYHQIDQSQKAAELLETGKAILLEKGFGTSAIYTATLINLGFIYSDLSAIQKARTTLLEAKELVLQIYGEEHGYYAAVLTNLAISYEKSKQYEEAKKLYLETARIDKKVIGEKHPYFMGTLGNTANIYALLKEPAKATTYYQQLIEGQTNLIYYYYSTFEEETRLSYIKKSNKHFEHFFSFVLDHDTLSPTVYKDMQYISLNTKSLALDFSVDNKVQIDSFKYPQAAAILTEWTTLRQQLSQAYTMSEKEKEQAGFDLKKMEEQVELLEKNLINSRKDTLQNQQASNKQLPIPKLDLRSQLYTKQRSSFEQMQATLAPQEAAVDFIKFNYRPANRTTDSIFYGALLTTSTDTTPHFLYLTEEKQLAKFVKAAVRERRSNYIENIQIGHDLYKVLWQPLLPYLQDIHTIKLSSTGLLHRVSFAALPTTITGDTLLVDQYQLEYYGNMRDLSKVKKTPPNRPKTIALMGGAKFDLDSLALVQLSHQLKDISADRDSIQTTQQAPPLTMATPTTRSAIRFNYLPGTQREVQSIQQHLRANDWQVQSYLGDQALEDQLKDMAQSSKVAPSVLHIATHGFFFAPFKTTGKPRTQTLRDRIKSASNPLLRSGLVFTGANHVWQGGGRIDGLEDGVLTAYEISNLDLFDTDLAVLSACETGLGDIDDTEGVFGLQRAFKMAGVDQLIISLWKIPDLQTTELMTLFYTFYRDSSDASLALYKAQQEMRKKYRAFYWAGFILVK